MYIWCSGSENLYTRPELLLSNRRFYHPLTLKLMNLIKKSSPDQADARERKYLKKLVQLVKYAKSIQDLMKDFGYLFHLKE